MAQPWIPDIDVTVSLARSMIEAQWPELAPVRVEPFGVGWDNTAYLVNEAYVFRFPHRRIAAPLMDAEIAVLPHVAPALPLPVPDPIFAGRPGGDYPWSFAGYRLLPGRPAPDAALDDAGRTRLAEPLAHFLACLHAIPLEPAYNLGLDIDLLGRIDPEKRIPTARTALNDVQQRGLMPDLQPLVAFVDDIARRHEAEEPAHTASLVLVHGDLYAAHLLIDASGALSGVIDWGDLHAGNPAADLMIAHLFLPPSAHPVFRAAYGQIPEADWRMARFRAVYHASVVAAYSHDIGNAPLLRESLAALGYIASVSES